MRKLRSCCQNLLCLAKAQSGAPWAGMFLAQVQSPLVLGNAKSSAVSRCSAMITGKGNNQGY